MINCYVIVIKFAILSRDLIKVRQIAANIVRQPKLILRLNPYLADIVFFSLDFAA